MTRIASLFIISLIISSVQSMNNNYKYPVKKITLAEFLYRRLNKFAINRHNTNVKTRNEKGTKKDIHIDLASLLHSLRGDKNIRILRKFIRNVKLFPKTFQQSTKLTSQTSRSQHNAGFNDNSSQRPSVKLKLAKAKEKIRIAR